MGHSGCGAHKPQTHTQQCAQVPCDITHTTHTCATITWSCTRHTHTQSSRDSSTSQRKAGRHTLVTQAHTSCHTQKKARVGSACQYNNAACSLLFSANTASRRRLIYVQAQASIKAPCKCFTPSINCQRKDPQAHTVLPPHGCLSVTTYARTHVRAWVGHVRF